MNLSLHALPHRCSRFIPMPACRCAIRPTELRELLSAVQGVREALAAAELRTAGGRGGRHGDPYTVRQLTRINIPADDPAVAQVGGRAGERAVGLVQAQPRSALHGFMRVLPLSPQPVSAACCRQPAPAPLPAATTLWRCSRRASACSSWWVLLGVVEGGAQMGAALCPAACAALGTADCCQHLGLGRAGGAQQLVVQSLFARCRSHLQACASLECDLIAVDLSRRLPYRFKPALVKAALARGLHFEVGAL